MWSFLCRTNMACGLDSSGRFCWDSQSVNPHHQFAKSRPGLAPEHDTKHITKIFPSWKKLTHTMKRHGKTLKNKELIRAKILSESLPYLLPYCPSFSWKYSSLSACKRKPCHIRIFHAEGHGTAEFFSDQTVGRFPSETSRPSQGSIAAPWLVSTPGGKPEFGMIWVLFFLAHVHLTN